MAVVTGEEEEWRQWQRATMGVVVLVGRRKRNAGEDSSDGGIVGIVVDVPFKCGVV
jgi:hypothetical protein